MNSPNTEERALNAAELAMVNETRPPVIEQKTREELTALIHRLRQAHSKALDIANRQKREMRGKAPPRGATPARENAGTVAKAQTLQEAILRVDQEIAKRAQAGTGAPEPAA